MKLYKEFYTLDDTLKIINTELQADFNQSDLLEFWLLDYFDLFLRFKSVINDEAKFWDGEEIKVNFDLIKDELHKLDFDDETIEQEEIDVIGMYSDFEDTSIEYIKTKQGNIDLIACNWMIVNKSTAEIKEDGIYIGSLSIGHDNKIINEYVPFLFSNIYITQKLPYSRFRVIKGDILVLIDILKRNAGLISEELQNPENENQHLKTRNTQLEQEITRLQAENEQLRAMQVVDNGGNVATLSEYEGELPPKTDADKLADFIELVFNPDLLDNGKIPTYSRLHTKLTAKYRDRKITAKNTIKKYLNQF